VIYRILLVIIAGLLEAPVIILRAHRQLLVVVVTDLHLPALHCCEGVAAVDVVIEQDIFLLACQLLTHHSPFLAIIIRYICFPVGIGDASDIPFRRIAIGDGPAMGIIHPG